MDEPQSVNKRLLIELPEEVANKFIASGIIKQVDGKYQLILDVLDVEQVSAKAENKPQLKRPLKVLLCHASNDKLAVRSLYQQLQAEEGIAPWLAEEDLLPGQKWQQEIPKVVRDADIVLVCLSESSITKSGYVQKEIKFALDVADEKPADTIFIIPVRLENCEVPERLRELHWVDLFAERGYQRLMKTLRRLADALH